MQKTTKALSSILMGFIVLMMALDAMLLVTSPVWLRAMYENNGVLFSFPDAGFYIHRPQGDERLMLIFVILSGIALGWILLETLRLLRRVHLGPFTMATARCLRRLAVGSTLQMLLFGYKMAFGPTVITLACAGLFLIGAMLFLVLADLFHAAAQLKEDNELTI